MPLLLLLKNWKVAGVGALVALIVFLAYQWRTAEIELSKAKLVYENPEVKIVTKTVTVTGPVQIITRVIERPTGEKETIVEERRGEIVETNATDTNTRIVPIAEALRPVRTDRYLLGLGLLNFSPRDVGNYTAYAGYGFRNRVDVLYGVSTYQDRFNQNIMVVFRF